MAAAPVSPTVAATWRAYAAGVAAEDAGAPQPAAMLQAVEALSGAGLGRMVGEHYADAVQRRLRADALPAFWARFERLRAATPATDAPAGGSGGGGAPLSLHAEPWLQPALEEGLPALCGAIAAQRARADAVASALERGAAAAGAAVAPPGPPPARALRSGLDAALHGAVLASAACPFGDALTGYFGARLREFAAARGRPMRDDDADADPDEADEGGEEDGDGMAVDDDAAAAMEGVEAGSAPDAAWRGRVAAVCASLASLGLAPLAEEAAAGALAAAVRSRLTHRARGAFDAPALAPARRWLAAVPLPFLACLLPALHGTPPAAAAPLLAAWRARLEYALCTALGALRTDELFDIVVDYPDSLPALRDLRACLGATSLAGALPAAFRAALRRRLLHAGAATSDILAQYVSAIKALRELDASGALLEAVSEPLRAYLRGRRDTIRCVVTLLTDADADADAGGAGESVLEELARAGDGGGGEDGDSDAEGDAPPRADWAAWAPAPAITEAGAAPTPAQARRGDVVALLVGIFGSRELFTAEFRSLLAERLLGRGGYDAERDVRTVELLKLRFGEAALHGAEVMLKDVADSRRTDSAVKAVVALPPGTQGPAASSGPPPGTVAGTIISQLFWPPFGADASAELLLPPPVEAALASYGARFEALKAPRKLLWRKPLGCVSLELCLGGVARTFTVTPAQAAVVWRFGERDVWRAVDLAAALGVPPAALRKKATLWLSAGVLTETRDAATGDALFAVADSFADADAGAAAGAAPDEAGAVASAEEQAAAEMAVYEQYVVGMLTNFESLPLERIHNMLKMFVSEPPYDKSAAQLETFLGRLVAEEKLLLDGGSYRRRV